MCFLVSVGIESLSDAHFMQYDLATLRAATRNFSVDNKLGEGGFGIVYKVLVTLPLTYIVLYSMLTNGPFSRNRCNKNNIFVKVQRSSNA